MDRDLNKSEIERLFQIVEWEPTAHQISKINDEIRRRLAANVRISIGDGQAIVAKVCPGVIVISTEGVDNSDLNALLSLAAKVK